MKYCIYVFILLLGLTNCKKKPRDYNYIKVLTITKTDSITDVNKGLKTENFLYYDPENDYAIVRLFHSANPDVYHTYKGHFKNKKYADSVAVLVSFLRKRNEVHISPIPDSNAWYHGPYLYVEYSDSTGLHYKHFIGDAYDTLDYFCFFFYNLEKLPWKKELVDNSYVNETEEVVKMLKAIGSYDRIVKPYIPLPCKKGIEIDKLYGRWRTIGHDRMDTGYKYDVYKIDPSGIISVQSFNYNEKSHEDVSVIKSIKNNEIILEYKNKLFTLEILNLCENCFEFRQKPYKQSIVLNRM